MEIHLYGLHSEDNDLLSLLPNAEKALRFLDQAAKGGYVAAMEKVNELQKKVAYILRAATF